MSATVINTYPLMSALGWGLLTLSFAIPIYDFVVAWRNRPVVMWDERTGTWRSARLIQREKGGR